MTEPFNNIAKEVGAALTGNPTHSAEGNEAEDTHKGLMESMKKQEQEQGDPELPQDPHEKPADMAVSDPDNPEPVANLE